MLFQNVQNNINNNNKVVKNAQNKIYKTLLLNHNVKIHCIYSYLSIFSIGIVVNKKRKRNTYVCI